MAAHLLSQVTLQFQAGSQLHGDLSAVVLTPDRRLWLGSDETATLECLDPIGDLSFENHSYFRLANLLDLPNPEVEIDIEGLDYCDRYLWVVGSHSHKRKKPKAGQSAAENIRRLAKVQFEPNRYLLARIPLVDGQLYRSCPHPDHPEPLTAALLETTKQGNELLKALASDSHLGPFITAGIPGKDNGLDIEGIAVHQDKVLLGLRGPVLRGWAIILELAFSPTNSTRLTLKHIGNDGELYKKHFFDLNGLGIRDLCWHGQDLLILAGPTMSLDGPVQVFRLKEAAGLNGGGLTKPDFVMDLPYGKGDHHAEGMTLFAAAQQAALLVVYDSPAVDTVTKASEVLADVFKLDSN